jgi:hypothetical protein
LLLRRLPLEQDILQRLRLRPGGLGGLRRPSLDGPEIKLKPGTSFPSRQNHLPQTNHHLKIPLNISPLVPYVPPSYLVLSLALVLVHTRHPQMTVPMRATCLRRGRVLKRANVIAQKALPDES